MGFRPLTRLPLPGIPTRVPGIPTRVPPRVPVGVPSAATGAAAAKGVDDTAAATGAAAAKGVDDTAAATGAAAAKGVDDTAAAAKGVDAAAGVTKKNSNYANVLKKKGKLAKGAAVVGGLAYASYESVKTWIEEKEEVDELVVECLLSCLPQHPNKEKPEAPPICLSLDNYNNEDLKDWYFPSKNELNGPDCEENSAVCKKPRDCTTNDARLMCKPNSKETFERCSEECHAKCKKCIPDPKALEAVVSAASENAGTVSGGVGEALGESVGGVLNPVAEALGIDASMILVVVILLIFFLLVK